MTDFRPPARLDARFHQRSDFRSGEPELDDWLRRYARQSQDRDTSVTWVISDANGRIVAYARLAMSGIDLSAAPAELIRGAPNPVPALLIGRLAVDERFTGLALGTELVEHVLITSIELSETAGCRAVVARALHKAARAWWERFGFRPFDTDDPECLDLYLLTSEIRETLEI